MLLCLLNQPLEGLANHPGTLMKIGSVVQRSRVKAFLEYIR